MLEGQILSEDVKTLSSSIRSLQGRKDWLRPALQDVNQHEAERKGGEAAALPVVDAAAPRPHLPRAWHNCFSAHGSGTRKIRHLKSCMACEATVASK